MWCFFLQRIFKMPLTTSAISKKNCMYKCCFCSDQSSSILWPSSPIFPSLKIFIPETVYDGEKMDQITFFGTYSRGGQKKFLPEMIWNGKKICQFFSSISRTFLGQFDLVFWLSRWPFPRSLIKVKLKVGCLFVQLWPCSKKLKTALLQTFSTWHPNTFCPYCIILT